MGPKNLHDSSKLCKATDVASLIPILKGRLPKSCNIYNMALMHSKFLKEMSFYTFCINDDSQSPSTDCCWIVAIYMREDYGIDVNISYPATKGGVREFKDSLISSEVIDWNENFIFAAIDEEIFFVVEELITEVCGKPSVNCKNVMYYINPQDTDALDLSRDCARVEIKPMDIYIGAKFLRDNWKFAKRGSLEYCQKLIERNGSAGVFVKGVLVSGVTMNGSGLISMLHTLTPSRHQGCAQLCMKYFVKDLAKQNLVPCCTVEESNASSIALQDKIGLKHSHNAFYFNRPV